MSDLRDLLKQYKDGKIDEDQLLKYMKLDYIEKIGDLANLDIFRRDRTGIPEVIFAQSKSANMLIQIVEKYLKNQDVVFISRIRKEQFKALEEYIHEHNNFEISLNKEGKVARIQKKGVEIGKNILGKIGVITAGTSDIPVAEEAKMVAEAMGCKVISSYDVGIAGFHRIFTPLKDMLLAEVSAIVVVAGMEGTLPGVVSALVDIPIIGVPTSTGYGYRGNGEGALTTMLQSCSPGLMVVNIDNGLGAGVSAALIAINGKKRKLKEKQE